MQEIIIIVFIYFIVIIGLSFIGAIIRLPFMKREIKKKQEKIKFYFDQELYDADYPPYKEPDFVNRFETDPWDLRL